MTRQSRVDRARRQLTGAGVNREDSDDELGLEDHPWEWIYGEANGADLDAQKSNESLVGTSDTESADALGQDIANRNRKRKGLPVPVERKIIGARMGDFQCQIGDCVLLKSELSNEAWVGLICEFLEDEDEEKAANFMWFSTEKEIRNKIKKRTDFEQNELYISPSWDINPLASINGKASVMSLESFLSRYPDRRVPKNAKEFGKTFICRRGCNTRTATYTDEFIWEDIYKGTEAHIFALIERIKSETKSTRKRRGKRSEDDDNRDEFVQGDEPHCHPETPRKKRKLDSVSTPTSRHFDKTPQKFTTPSHKRVTIKKPLEFTPLGTRILSPSRVSSSPFQIARSRLHVSSVPATLPCREQEFAAVYSHLETAISDGSSSCIYISGTPGTGKTATVREVIAQLNAAVLADEIDDFIFVEINGMKVTDPHQSYSLLWEALKGDRISPAHALELLEHEFGNPSPRRVPCVVLMDELDQLVTRNQSVMYNFFNWPGLRHSRLIVLAVANTMDLPERTLSNKISSRLGLTRITFPGYTHDQLMRIVQSRLEGVPGDIVDSDAVQFASRKVAAVSGDARRALDICRRAVEIAEAGSRDDAILPPTPTKKAKEGNASTKPKAAKVTINTIKQAINEATTSPLQQYLRCLPLASKVFLAAVLSRVERTGIAESVVGDVLEEAKRIGRMADNIDVQNTLMSEATIALKQKHPPRWSQSVIIPPRVLSMGGAAMELMEAGIVGFEVRKGERTGKVRLSVGNEEVKLALRDDPEVRGLGFAN
ncbi:MAG: hypothetical protein M1819_000108 [Sarea resinae]|nr:MAG: hypothetical protein M1819_000108 [Sarea resinae]